MVAHGASRVGGTVASFPQAPEGALQERGAVFRRYRG